MRVLRCVLAGPALAVVTVMTFACGRAEGQATSAEPNHTQAGGDGTSASVSGGGPRSSGGSSGFSGSSVGGGGVTSDTGVGGSASVSGGGPGSSGGSSGFSGSSVGGGGATSDAGVGGSAGVAGSCPGAVRLCADGTGACDLGECPGQCDPSECAGRPPDVTRVFCQDQTIGGPYCARDDSGACSWQLRDCPVANECEDDVIACTADTATMRMPPDCNVFGHCQVFCEPGTRYYVPGCAAPGDPVLPEQGCYVPCPDGAACPDGSVCREVVTDPCAFSTCLTCGSNVRVCVGTD